jgi:hypothetical protein
MILGTTPPPIPPPRYTTSAPTIEALGVMRRDVLTGWFRTLDRDGHESEPGALAATGSEGRMTNRPSLRLLPYGGGPGRPRRETGGWGRGMARSRPPL